ncbi:MAG: acetyl-CoA carboxylase carboxyl transferase subunit beta, partial [Chloroflexi bacterium]|nr:acetyl-CoA carboxylase carboxyl transferase subunit beta [Chloroflexota bacterium]
MTNVTATNEPPPALSAREWIELLFDEGSFDEAFTGVPTPDPLHFEDAKTYPERLEEARRASGGQEAVVTGIASIGGMRVVAAISDFRFIGGSMGFAVGERIAGAMERAAGAKVPFVAITCSGGALIGFAGPRVRAVHDANEERESLYAEDLLAAGHVDAVCARESIRDSLITLVSLVRPTPAADLDLLPPVVQPRGLERGWVVVQRARHPERPRALAYIRGLTSDYFPLHGDRTGIDDPALIGGLARLGDTNVVVIGQERGDMTLEGTRHDGRVAPAVYRKARRLMLLAERLRLPLVTFVDTPGAHDGIADESAGLAVSISDCLATMASLTTPAVSVVIGEGGSGGALALTVADRILMQQNAMYSVTSPEGAAAILFRDRARAPEVAEALGVAA